MEHKLIYNTINEPGDEIWEIEFLNPETSKKTMLFVGCTKNYLDDHFNGSGEDFYNFVINKYASNTDIVFDEKIIIKPYADTEGELKNINDFLIKISRKI